MPQTKQHHKVEFNIIRNGIYSLDGLDEGNNEDIVVAVHPFYLGYKSRDYHPSTILPSKYIHNAKQVVREHKGPLVTLENYNDIGKTAGRYLSIGRKNTSIFVSTSKSTSELRFITFEEFCEFLHELNGDGLDYHSDEVSLKLFGGKLVFHRGEGDYWGCLGSTTTKLAEKGFHVEVIPGATF